MEGLKEECLWVIVNETIGKYHHGGYFGYLLLYTGKGKKVGIIFDKFPEKRRDKYNV